MDEKKKLKKTRAVIRTANLSKSDPNVSSQTTLNVQNDSLNNSINGSSVSSNRNVNSVRLPKLQIDKYFGDPCVWLEFWNKFQNSIDKNETLTKVDKFSYLKSLLEGVACNVVNGFALSDDNYDNALILLKGRFGREERVAYSHMSKLLDLYPVKDSNKVIGLRKLYDICKIQIRSLESLNVTSEMYGHLLQPILKLLSEDLVLDFNRKKRGNDSNNVTFNLPHREVIRKDRPSSLLRIVYDASSHDANSPSLNSCLHIGPNLYPEIFDILLRFRLSAVAFNADMKQAFLQIMLNEEDRDVTKFLFSNEPSDESQPLSVNRFTRVLFGISSIERNYKTSFEEIFGKIKQQYFESSKTRYPLLLLDRFENNIFLGSRATSKIKPFIKNRIQEIQKLTSPSNWHHCPGIQNPADIVSRGVKISRLLNDTSWLKGSEWLRLPPEFWPESKNEDSPIIHLI
ncbi:reverse transcriptase domain-containing protein [Trichonephila inaurata madagascariensis]|uniref:Reverse transcriptase domain-containing protein n=1 Tax=Trichonephila inaurata madagascariensis TaxID=2747483 RepID=A0A8X6X317_9ARAC|nr:reverse transcriptase domain-containing protein [Trichonephila inaurata madagascariensis]